MNNHIDINQVGQIVFPIKELVEKEILNYSGQEFFSKVKFLSVQIVYPDSIEKFSGRMPSCILDRCNAKFFFYYMFSPVENANYHIGIATNEKGEIINKFNFPTKKKYKPVDTTLNVCQVVEITKKYKEQIDSIKTISFDYNAKTKRFYWKVKEQLKNEKAGANKYQELIIDAFDPSKVEIRERKLMIMY